ncbi:MAG: DUF1295 domain-containing protein [Deltaproteobacteria bacterium]|nr:DUF1295 domain-containing protein [Deltaproteobacteria bacterium]
MISLSIIILMVLSITLFGLLAKIQGRGEFYDIGWCWAIFCVYTGGAIASNSPYSWLIWTLVLIWSVKLISVILIRIAYFEHDFRYKDVKRHVLASAFQLVSAALFVIPAFTQIHNPTPFNSTFFFICVFLSLLSLGFNSFADFQIVKLKLKKENRFLNSNLWRVSRYPNYTFEILFWFFLAISQINSVLELVNILTPLYAYFIIRYFSGIPYQEPRRLSKFGKEYEEYSQKVPLLFPGLK